MNAYSQTTLKNIETLLLPFFESHNVLKAIVFGSYAGKTNTRKSDLDLILVMDTEKRFFDRYYIPTRYPNGLPELTPDEAYFEEDAQGALLLAQNLIDCVEKIIGTE